MRETATERNGAIERAGDIDKKRTMLLAIATVPFSRSRLPCFTLGYIYDTSFSWAIFPVFSTRRLSLSLPHVCHSLYRWRYQCFLLSLFLYLLHLLSAIYIQMQNSIFRTTNLATQSAAIHTSTNKLTTKKGQNEQIMLKHSIVR